MTDKVDVEAPAPSIEGAEDSVDVKTGAECWKEVLGIGGETVYCYLQTAYVIPDGIAVSLVTIAIQLFAFQVFIYESIVCSIVSSDDCSLTGGILDKDENGTFHVKVESASPQGIICGLVIALIFLLPDFTKGIVFFKKGYIMIGIVHTLVSLVAILASILYCATTAISDVSVLTNIVVLVFLTDLDERMFEVHGYARNFFRGKYVTMV
ncbi:Hypothetical Protein FCC1311_069252 [Hondaea fermentalgiana]|uniref:Uncharacterized protein n=1 Tax=Hondaea fermentalgiana TaxID=2315210 RepID=A0A2R5GJB3_9STRA|nr:Hypothetical Protein FCC1311_069252 [Hondaea fermentalgiana]|eukprot:GBG30705.1 Hypothetical Protein FCC1311_069252 [Hondaea fermentalgiana]